MKKNGKIIELIDAEEILFWRRVGSLKKMIKVAEAMKDAVYQTMWQDDLTILFHFFLSSRMTLPRANMANHSAPNSIVIISNSMFVRVILCSFSNYNRINIIIDLLIHPRLVLLRFEITLILWIGFLFPKFNKGKNILSPYIEFQ